MTKQTLECLYVLLCLFKARDSAVSIQAFTLLVECRQNKISAIPF